MKIQKQTQCNDIKFKHGLNKDIINNSKIIDTKEIEKIFERQFSIDTKFDSNKPNAICTFLTSHLFHLLSQKYKEFTAKPPRIRSFHPKELITPQKQSFCLKDSQLVMKKEPPFEMRSIFYNEPQSLEFLNDIIETQYNHGERSSNHFLSEHIHEWLHNIHIDSIYKRFGYGGNCVYGRMKYPERNSTISGINIIKNLEIQKLDNKEKEITKDILGTYSTKSNNEYFEIFAEAFTQIICKSIDKDCLSFKQNPIEILKKYPKDFKKILLKIFNFE